jgi:SAM-dependent methyltransferase
MHPSAYRRMAECVEKYLPKDRRHVVLDFGSYSAKPHLEMTHRELLAQHDCELVGVDIRGGDNVDVVMKKPYRIPMKANSVDAVLSGQVFEHIPFFWASMLEITRVLKPGGHFIMTAPSRGHIHMAMDCWRYYPDGVHAMGAFAGLEVLEAFTDFPPTQGVRHDFGAIDAKEQYWGDTVGVFRKPEDHPSWRLALVREPLLWWANRAGDQMARPRRRARMAQLAPRRRSAHQA